MTKNIRKIRIEENLAFVPLSGGYVATIDASDLHLVDSWNWSSLASGKRVYAVRMKSGRARWMHREIFMPPKNIRLTHINKDGLDNRRKNITIDAVDHVKNMVRSYMNDYSDCDGVSWHPKSGSWEAYITENGNDTPLGKFSTPQMARHAYDHHTRNRRQT